MCMCMHGYLCAVGVRCEYCSWMAVNLCLICFCLHHNIMSFSCCCFIAFSNRQTRADTRPRWLRLKLNLHGTRAQGRSATWIATQGSIKVSRFQGFIERKLPQV